MEEKQKLTSEQLENELKSRKTKALLAKILTYGCGLLTILLFAMNSYVVAVICLVLTFVGGYQMSKQGGAIKTLLGDNVIKNLINEVFDGAEYAPFKHIDTTKVTDAGMVLTCLAPLEDYAGEIGNASSMVLSLQYREFDMLFTGDVEEAGEDALSESGTLRTHDVLKVAHHGSKNSTSEQFLEQVSPAIAFISAGRENRYGHPHGETIEKLENCGCKIYSTQYCGAIILYTDGKKIKIQSYL